MSIADKIKQFEDKVLKEQKNIDIEVFENCLKKSQELS